MAFVSAAGLGAGLLGLVPVLRNILGEDGATLPAMAAELDGRLAKTAWLPSGVRLPPGWIASLPEGRFDAVLWVVVALGILTVIGATANFLHAYLSLTLSTRTVAAVRRSAFHRVLHAPLKTVVQGQASDLISRIISDTNSLSRGFQSLTDKAVAQVTRGAAMLAVAFTINWKLSAATLLIAPLMAIIIRKIGKRIRRASRNAMKSQAKLLATASEVLHGFRVVKVYANERNEIGRFSRANREVVAEHLRVRTAKALAGPLMETITIFVVGALAIVAARQIIEGNLDATSFMLTLASLGVAGGAMRPLNSVIQDIQMAEAAAGRLRSVMEIEPEDWADTRKPRLPRHAESVEFDGVTLRYDGQNTAAVDGVSLRVRHGEVVAFVGPNGCGKTSLLSLVPLLFAPDAGRIMIDGVDIAKVSLRSLRRQIGVVTQETALFRGTIAANIAYGCAFEGGDVPMERIVDAAKRAHAHEFIMKQPQGYDTLVGDQGLTLSGGQRQRVAIARAIIRDPAILILDEATSMIDAESEAQISEAIAEFGRGRTCLIVAHRLSTVRRADRIVVMERGRIIDSGRHDELVDRCPLYRGLAQHQLAGAGGPGFES